MLFVSFDERFSSKQASALQSGKNKTIEELKRDKLKNHAIAAAFIIVQFKQKNNAAILSCSIIFFTCCFFQTIQRCTI